jgi:hypothetical protein
VDNTLAPGTVAAGVPTTASSSSNLLFNDADLLASYRGTERDFLARLSAGYARDFSPGGNGTMTRVSIASAELFDRDLGLRARLGRQVRNEDGILGTFDGLLLSYQFLPGWSASLAGGYPVLQLNAEPRTNHRFESAALAYAPDGAHWDVSAFYETQQFDGLRDRQAVGLQARYLAPRASLVALTDYDIAYHALNVGALIGTLQLPQRWSLSLDAERRNSPILATGNALIGQPVTTLAALEQSYALPQIYQLARDRTAPTSDYSLTIMRPLGERLQIALTAAVTQTGAMPASGGVDAQSATGAETLAQLQLYGHSLLWEGDFQVLSVEHARTEVGVLDSVGVTTRFPAIGAWRIGPRLNVTRETLSADGSSELVFLPSMLLDYQRRRSLLQFEAGGELGSRKTPVVLLNMPQQTQNTTRYYASLSYRIAF